MSSRFVLVDRNTPMLLPPSLQDWFPEGHLAHFVVETVTVLPWHGFQVNTRGTGNASKHAAVDVEGSMLVLGAYVTDAPNDKQQLVAAVASVVAETPATGPIYRPFNGLPQTSSLVGTKFVKIQC
jgi:hypothetical protein